MNESPKMNNRKPWNGNISFALTFISFHPLLFIGTIFDYYPYDNAIMLHFSKKFKQFFPRFIPSHLSPVYCFGHLQTGVPSLSMHVPPFWHGFGSQLFVAAAEKITNN